MNMLARVEELNAKEIAAMVPKSSRLENAEKQLAEVRGRKAALAEKIRALIAVNGEHAHDREIMRLAAGEAPIDAEIVSLRAVVRPMRLTHAEAVADAMKPICQDAAARVVDLIAEIRPALEVIAESMIAIERAGGQTARMPIGLNEIEALARRIAAPR